MSTVRTQPPAARGGLPGGLRKAGAIVIVLAVLGAAGLLLFQRQGGGDPPVAQRVGGENGFFATVERRDIRRELEMTGDVAPSFEVEIKPEVGGKITRLHVAVNDTVERGQLVAEIDDSDLRTEKAAAETDIAGAQLTVERTRRDFERTRGLFERELASTEQFDNDRAEFDLAMNAFESTQRRLDQIEERIRKTRIEVPASGTVLDVPVLEGQVVVEAASVNSGTTLMKIADLSQLLVQTHINQVDAAALRLGQHADLRSEAFPEEEMHAEVTFIAPIATPKNNIKGFEVELAIRRAPERLRPGMTVSVTVPVEEVQNVLAVPVAAVFRRPADDVKIAYVHGDRRAEERLIDAGVSDLFFVEVRSGLNEGDVVLLAEPAALEIPL